MSLFGVGVSALPITCCFYGGGILTFWGNVREVELTAVSATPLRIFCVRTHLTGSSEDYGRPESQRVGSRTLKLRSSSFPVSGGRVREI